MSEKTNSAFDIPGYGEMIVHLAKQPEPNNVLTKAIKIVKMRIDFWSSIND